VIEVGVGEKHVTQNVNATAAQRAAAHDGPSSNPRPLITFPCCPLPRLLLQETKKDVGIHFLLGITFGCLIFIHFLSVAKKVEFTCRTSTTKY
jgi:hypothetical protein